MQTKYCIAACKQKGLKTILTSEVEGYAKITNYTPLQTMAK